MRGRLHETSPPVELAVLAGVSYCVPLLKTPGNKGKSGVN